MMRIVWEDCRNGNIDIYTYDIATGDMDPVVTDPSMQFLNDVSGYRIVWTDLKNANQENPTNYDICMFQIEAPPTPTYTLTIQSPPSGVTFTINETQKTIPYTELLSEGYYTLVMPETHNGYVWSHWLEDGDPNRIKTILLQGTTWTAMYEPAPAPRE